MKHIDKKMMTLLTLSLVYGIFSVYVYKTTGLSIHRGMIWNLFLALLPLAISIAVIIFSEKKKKTVTILLGLLWLSFFPNAPYMITGFIHLSTINFYTSGEFDIISWLRLIHFGIGALLGILIGMVSLYNVHQALLQFYTKRVVYIIILIISLLSGYAIYVGRLLRFNTWDILNPVMLFTELLSNLNLFALLCTILFAFFILFTYIMYYHFFSKE